MEENKTKNEQEQPQNVVSTRKWLYYPLLLLSFFVIFAVAVLLGEMFERNSAFTEGLAGVGVLFVWGVRNEMKGACSKGSGFKPMIMYWGLILAYCGFLLSVSAFGIILGAIVAVVAFALLYFVIPMLLNNKSKVILLLLLLSASLANAGGICVSSEKQMGKMRVKVSFIRDEVVTGYINGEYDIYK